MARTPLLKCWMAGALALVLAVGIGRADVTPIPFVKQMQTQSGRLPFAAVTVAPAGADLAAEVETLRSLLAERGIAEEAGGAAVRLELADVEFPKSDARYRAEIEKQGYRLTVSAAGVTVQARTPVGVFYGLQTLIQLVDADQTLPYVEVLDWPDLAIRAIMVDAARANENFAYYARVLRFCAHYKINRLHLHLTDDENASLYLAGYPSIMHPHAWHAEQLAPLVKLAAELHIELVPEIESLGHARLFTRHPDAAEFLHQTTDEKPKKSWAGTALRGLTNVLCPASDRALAYLDAMYAQVARIFPAKEIHIGCDEVDMTECARCRAKFGDISHGEWFLRHFLRCRALAQKYGRTVGLWGDVLLHHRE
ncbi:MAG TPA: family 20 glycosylhydrolase, partial [Phycisphaerae bacterium]|nr:family 20 glycosylhydrolase [Phycisphaerae bacterium]